jgi:AmmeMemoRadiSam system protein A
MSPLSDSAQSELLRLSRCCLEDLFARGEKKILSAVSIELLEPRGVFVTLHCNGKLRGCIGVPLAIAPLYEAAQNCAIAAAKTDPRFTPVIEEELGQIQIEISVLSALEPVYTIEEVEVGTYGLLLTHIGKRGLLLPQVAVEHGWDRVQFLQHLCRKAGLPTNAWKEGAKIERFRAQVFAEQ